MQTVTSQTLAAIGKEIAADSALLSSSVAVAPAAAGFASLFAAAAGPVPEGDRQHYLFSLEYVFEGYLLHFGSSRMLPAGDTGFTLLAGDYMYAQGLNRISRLEDAVPIRLLSGLVSLCSFVQCEELDPQLALEAWSAASLCLAAYASGADPGCVSEFIDLVTVDFHQGVARLPALKEERLAAFAGAARERLEQELDDIYSVFIPVFTR